MRPSLSSAIAPGCVSISASQVRQHRHQVFEVGGLSGNASQVTARQDVTASKPAAAIASSSNIDQPWDGLAAGSATGSVSFAAVKAIQNQLACDVPAAFKLINSLGNNMNRFCSFYSGKCLPLYPTRITPWAAYEAVQAAGGDEQSAKGIIDAAAPFQTSAHTDTFPEPSLNAAFSPDASKGLVIEIMFFHPDSHNAISSVLDIDSKLTTQVGPDSRARAACMLYSLAGNRAELSLATATVSAALRPIRKRKSPEKTADYLVDLTDEDSASAGDASKRTLSISLCTFSQCHLVA